MTVQLPALFALAFNGFGARERLKSDMLRVNDDDHAPRFPASSLAWTRQYQTDGLSVKEIEVPVKPALLTRLGEVNDEEVSAWKL